MTILTKEVTFQMKEFVAFCIKFAMVIWALATFENAMNSAKEAIAELRVASSQMNQTVIQIDKRLTVLEDRENHR